MRAGARHLGFVLRFFVGVSGDGDGSRCLAAQRRRPFSTIAPRFRNPPALDPILRQVAPGRDAFPEEKIAEELEQRLAELEPPPPRAAGRNRGGPSPSFSPPDFKGGSLRPAERGRGAPRPLRSRSLAASRKRSERDSIAPSSAERSQPSSRGSTEVTVAEFLITAHRGRTAAASSARTDVRYDIVGSGPEAWRAERVGHWRMAWRRGRGRGVARLGVDRLGPR